MNVFTYGSLMCPAVWTRVTGLEAAGAPARLAEHAARRLLGFSYPALIESRGAETRGVLYQNITAEALARLDTFEGTYYDRVMVTVPAADGAATSAWVYRAARADDPAILTEEWDAADFEQNHLEAFLSADPGFSEAGR